jgi:hypothetical protein
MALVTIAALTYDVTDDDRDWDSRQFVDISKGGRALLLGKWNACCVGE